MFDAVESLIRDIDADIILPRIRPFGKVKDCAQVHALAILKFHRPNFSVNIKLIDNNGNNQVVNVKLVRIAER